MFHEISGTRAVGVRSLDTRCARAIVGDLATRRGIQVVLNAETAIIWAPSDNELTSDVLERLNATN